MYLCVCVQHYAFKCCTTCNRQLLTEAYTTEPIDFHILRYDTHICIYTYIHKFTVAVFTVCCCNVLLFIGSSSTFSISYAIWLL